MICNVGPASRLLILLTTVKLMKSDSEASDPKHLQHFLFLFRLKCSKHFDNFTLRIPTNFMSGVFEIIKPIKLTCSFCLSAFFVDAACSVHYLFKVLSFSNIICRIETHPILFKAWKQNKQHHLEWLDNIHKYIPQKQKRQHFTLSFHVLHPSADPLLSIHH